MSVSIQNVVVEYASRRILHGIDLEIDAGEFVSIVGETGVRDAGPVWANLRNGDG